MKPCMRGICRIVFRLAVRLPLIALLACTLLLLAPGFDSDELSLDPRLSSSSISARREARREMRNPLVTTARYFAAIARGDLGESTTFGAPVLVLFRDRWPVSCVSLVEGLAGGWLLAAAGAALSTGWRSRTAHSAMAAAATLLICIPSGLLGLVAMLAGGPVAAALTAVIFPRVYQYTDRLLARAERAPHVIPASAAGIGPWRLFWFHCLTPALPELIAVAASSVAAALASLVPLEVVCDSPGLGQLAWKATLARDLPLLLSVTLAVAAASNLFTAVADTAVDTLVRERA